MPNKNKPTSLCVLCDAKSQMEKAKDFAKRYEYPFFSEMDTSYELQLVFERDKIVLFDKTLNTKIFVDFIDGSLAHREKYGGGKGQAIAKAIGLNKMTNPSVIDATAGLARDAYVLAALGCKVTLVEQSPVLYTLIRDGIDRALTSTQEHSVTNFTHLVNANSKTYLEHSNKEPKPDVIYIDPMYPERKKSALVKKDMQILHKLIGESENEVELLSTALNYADKRVVVKRPAHAPIISGQEPTMSISSKKTRYDVYIIS